MSEFDTTETTQEPTGDSDVSPLYLDTDERRVIGVMIEKSLTTPANYPMTINAVVTGSNQKSNRNPLVEFVEAEAEEILQRLRSKGLALVLFPAGSRVEKWRQEMTSSLNLTGQEMAVVAELLLRGPQTTGELRTRASRMKKIPDQATLNEVMDGLMNRPQPLVVRLSPEGMKRGVRVTHGLYPPAELTEIIDAEASGAPAAAAAPRSSARSEIDDLKRRIEAIEAHLGIQPPESPE